MALNSKDAVRMARAMRDEAKRATAGIRCAPHPRPYYVSFLARDEECVDLKASVGGLVFEEHERERHAFCDVRVGSARWDQVDDGGLFDNATDDDSYACVSLPFDGSPRALQLSLWRLAEVRYREAAEDFAKRKALSLTYRERNPRWPSFQLKVPDAGTEKLAWREVPDIDVDYWRDYVQRASAVLRRYPEVMHSSVRATLRNQARAFAASDGTVRVQSGVYWTLECQLWLVSDSGNEHSTSVYHFVSDPGELPARADFEKEIRAAVAKLHRLSAAPRMHAYAGPVLLDAQPAGLFMHEAVGHRLEGNRLLCAGEAQTFGESVGDQILPDYLSISDDPSVAALNGRSLTGHYAFDDEGVAAQPASLVEDGVLLGFLTSRAGISRKHESNGHGRSRRHERPMSRMAVTHVESRDGFDAKGMKQALIDEVVRQGLPYGIRILSATGGETATESYNFQAFLGEIDLAARVYPDGREELVSGVDFVGTPLNALRHILAAGDKPCIDNSFCGAESGWLPVTTICPSLLMAHLELQAKEDNPFTPPCYPRPF